MKAPAVVGKVAGPVGRVLYYVLRYGVTGILAALGIAAIGLAMAIPLFGSASGAQQGLEAARATGLWLIIGLLLACAAAFIFFMTELAKKQL